MLAQRRPRALLALLTLAVLLTVTHGEFGDEDTTRRLQVTHWLWTSEPQVSDEHPLVISANPTRWNIMARPGFCSLPGKNGEAYAQFSLGQSLLMLPGDILGRLVTGKLDSEFVLDDGLWSISAQETIVNFTTFYSVDALAIILSFELLLLLGFSQAQALAASALLLVASTFLVYMADVAETNQIYCCFVGALAFALKARRGRFGRNCAIAGAFLGFSALMKLPNLVFLPAILLVFLFCGEGERSWSQRLRWALSREAGRGLICFLAPLCGFLLVDRFYQYYRFGDWFGTYMKPCAEAYAAAGGYPPGYPFGYDRIAGALGPFLSADRSLFLFEPFLIFTIPCIALCWKRLPLAQRLAIASAVVALLGLALVYGGTYYWNGGAGSWGPRHHLPPAQALCLIGFALAAEKFSSLGAFGKSFVLLSLGVAIGNQSLALLYSPLLENQEYFLDDPLRLVPLMRLRNACYLVNGSLLPHAETFNSPELSSWAKMADLYSPSILWFWLARAASAKDALLAGAILSAWALLGLAVAFATALLVVVGFRPAGGASIFAAARPTLSGREASLHPDVSRRKD
ncbi:MAG TPA: glycosyltransferase family 39 protein [Methylocystis sp.]|nr:glycosyltransferase family 39 protein [Methylocystis sp.]